MRPIAEFATTAAGGTPKAKTPEFYGGDIPWLKIGDLTDGEVSQSSERITQAGLDASSAKWIEPGAVLVAMYGSIGKLGLLRIRATTNQAICAITPSPDIATPEWVYWALRADRSRLDEIGRGGTQRNISQGDLRQWEIPIPSLDKQHAIVEAIEAAFARIDEIEAELDQVDLLRLQARRSALRRAFRAEGIKSSSTPASQWVTSELGEIADCVLGKMLDKAKNVGELRPYLGNVNVRWGSFDLGSLKEMRIRTEEIDRYAVRDGDLVVCEGGEPGRCAVWRGGDGVFLQKALHRVRPYQNASADYLALYLEAFVDSSEFEGFLTGTTIRHLPGQALRKIPVPMPSLAEQEEIVTAIRDAFRGIDEMGESAAEIRAECLRLRASTLHAAFSGKLV
jgi:type I restriction enzyme S subunit